MPSTIVCHGIPTGLTVTASLFADGSDTVAASGLAMTEATNRKTTYSFSTSVTGLHLIHVLNGTQREWIGWCNVIDGQTIDASETRVEAQGLLDVAVSTRLATASYAAPPAAATVASAVRTELTTELGRIDAAVSTRLAPTTAGRTLDVTATGAAGIDWGNIENKTTVNALTGTTIDLSSLSGVAVTVTSPVISNEEIELVVGDDYYHADGSALTFTFSGITADWTSATTVLGIRQGCQYMAVVGTVVIATGATRVVRFEIPSASTSLFKASDKSTFWVGVELANTHTTTQITQGKVTWTARDE